MSVSLSPLAGAGWQFFDNNGVPLNGGLLYTYAAGTTTPAATYTSDNGVTANANPIVLDSSGRTPSEVWLTDGTTYKIAVYTSTNVLIRTWDDIAGINDPTALEAALASSTGSSMIGFIQAGANAVTRTAQSKMRDTVSVKDFGAVGDGVADDTAAIQAALSSGAKAVVIPAGSTYIINGGLTLPASGVTVQATGATIKLKNSASSLAMLYITGNDCVVDGGTWDGNKANGNIGVWGSAQFGSYNIAMYADRCTVKNIDSTNTWGIGVKGFGNYLSVLNCRIQGTQAYGIFFDGSASVSHAGNRAVGNIIDMTDGQVVSSANQGQGVLFTAGSGQNQTAWELSNNNIIGPTTSVTDQAINLAVRGKDGVVSNNTTRYGAMGFSEGGDNCTVSGNQFLDLRGTVRIGVEPSGRFTATGNTITDAYIGVDCTASVNYDESVVTGNSIRIASGGANAFGVRFQIASTYTGKNIVVSGNSINTPNAGVYLVRSVEGLTVSGNTIVGPGIGSGRGVFLDGLTAAAFVSIIGNTFRGFLRPWGVYSVTAVTYTDLYAASNVCIDCGSSRTTWPVEGSAVIGARATVLNAEYGTYDMRDVAGNVFTLYSTAYSNPEGFLTAGIGSIYVSLNSGGGVYRKNTGVGNTGWVAM